ncbi:DUF2501 domain-containing protein [Gluconobacter cerevisiae]|uniref:DUF2501 domain-containing protein n=1 Tax=Gluconobacter cerevisiae TaxID=1379734 RepID=A0ABR9YAV1_9PROT|nr:DUF2501 domain-containing protein [Gluconobacter cerevisiae]MBF0875492.1 DUF2501 domain-containing protein [Gluconobacter cerevisiae]
MISSKYFAVLAAAGLSISGAAVAQTVPPIPQSSPVTTIPAGTQARLPGAHVQAVAGGKNVLSAASPGVLGADGLPSIEGAQAGNIAGLTYYCTQHKLVLGTSPIVAARKIAKRPDVHSDEFYSLGGKGLLQMTDGNVFDIGTLSKDKRVTTCNDLVKKAQSFK